MSTKIKDLTDGSVKFEKDSAETFALDVLMGFSSKPKCLPPLYFYDTEGSKIFQQIMDLPEYYPTQCETEILETYSEQIADFVPDEPTNIIELGAGDGKKTKILLEQLLAQKKQIKYAPLDISRGALESLCSSFSKSLPALEMTPVVAEYYDGLKWINSNVGGKNLILFLGSNIGNFSHSQALVFLRTLWNALNDGDLLLLGCDLKKDIDVMLHAYNDSQKVTERFNLNLLTRMNRELGANFDLSKFRHFGTYNLKLGAMESFLVSMEKQEVYIKALDRSFNFKPHEPIHCEYSSKYLPSEVIEMAGSTGYTVKAQYFDQKKYFSDTLLQVKKS